MSQQNFRLYYQEVDGAIQEIKYDTPDGGWKDSTPIITDARRNSGVAAFTYLDNGEQTVRRGIILFLVDMSS